MALIKCSECGHEVSDKAKACPNCGAKPKVPRKFFKYAGGFLAILFVLAVIGQLSGQQPSQSGQSPTPSPQPEQAQTAQPKEVPVSFDMPLETKSGTLVCPLSAALDNREGHGLQAAMKSRLEVFGRQEDAEKAGCQEWREGLPIQLSDKGQRQAKEWQAEHTCGMLTFDAGFVFSCDLRNSTDNNARPQAVGATSQPTYAVASDGRDLETSLITALSLKKGTTERIGDSGKAIQAYIRSGLINNEPNQRADYTDYYLLKKPASFMGHELVVIEEEYMVQYVGCCVSPGAGISVKLTGSAKNLEDFAQLNKCTLNKDINLQKELQDVSIKVTLRQGNYANLSCRERDADR